MSGGVLLNSIFFDYLSQIDLSSAPFSFVDDIGLIVSVEGARIVCIPFLK